MMEDKGHQLSYTGLVGNGRRPCGQWALIRRLDAVFSGVTKLTLTILGSLCVLFGVLTFGGAPARAAVTHDFLPE